MRPPFSPSITPPTNAPLWLQNKKSKPIAGRLKELHMTSPGLKNASRPLRRAHFKLEELENLRR